MHQKNVGSGYLTKNHILSAASTVFICAKCSKGYRKVQLSLPESASLNSYAHLLLNPGYP